MPLVKFTPWNHYLDRPRGFQNLWSEMNHLFDSFAETSLTGREGTFVPALDVKEDEKNIYVHAELPGLDENNIDLSVNDGVLTLKGEKRSEERKEGQNHIRVERSYGSFQRSVHLGTDIEEGKVEATFKNGLLSVTLPKQINSKKEQKIKIRA